MINIFEPVSEDEIMEIIQWRFMHNAKSLDQWYSECSKIRQPGKVEGINSTCITDPEELQYQYYRKKLDIYIDTCFAIRSKYLKPIKDEKKDIEYLNKMWYWVKDKERRNVAIKDTSFMVSMLKKEVNSNIRLLKAQKYKINIFTLIVSILSGFGGAIIALWIK